MKIVGAIVGGAHVEIPAEYGDVCLGDYRRLRERDPGGSWGILIDIDGEDTPRPTRTRADVAAAMAQITRGERARSPQAAVERTLTAQPRPRRRKSRRVALRPLTRSAYWPGWM